MLRVCVFFLVGVLSNVAMALSYTVEITEEELQEKVVSMMPLSKKHSFITVTVSDPKIELFKESDKVGVFVNVDVRALGGIYGTGRGKVVGSLSYNADETAFYFQDIVIDSFELDQLPGEAAPSLEIIAQAVGIVANQALQLHPIYILNDTDMKEKLLGATLESIKVDGGKLLVTMTLL